MNLRGGDGGWDALGVLPAPVQPDRREALGQLFCSASTSLNPNLGAAMTECPGSGSAP